VSVCPPVRTSVRHKPAFRRNGYIGLPGTIVDDDVVCKNSLTAANCVFAQIAFAQTTHVVRSKSNFAWE